jgi:hypothetical protein
MVDLHPDLPHLDLAGYVLGTLDPAEVASFEAHLAGCARCQADLDNLRGLPALIADMAPAETLPAGLEDRTFSAVAASARGDDVPSQPSGRVVPIDEAERHRRHSRRFAGLVAAAAVVVAAAVGAVVATHHRSPVPLATINLVAATGGPARATAVVRATPIGLTIDMTATGLAPNPPGTMDTCWLVGPGDTLTHPNRVSVGSFVVPAGTRTVHVHWTTGADLVRHPTLGVTLEPANGNPSHQGPKLLVAV